MYFRDPKEQLPETYKTVFVKQKGNLYCFAYYSSTGKWYPDLDYDIEVMCSIDVIGWLPVRELDSIEIR